MMKRNLSCLGTLCGLAVCFGSASAAAQDELAPAVTPVGLSSGRFEYDLVLGENRTLSAVNVKNYSEGEQGVVDIKLTTDKTQFVVVGRSPGATTLLFIMKDGTQVTHEFNVFARSPATVKRELEDLLQGIGDTRVRRLGPRFFVEGSVQDERDVQRVQRIAALYPGQVEALVGVGAPKDERQLNIRLDFFFIQYDKRSGYSVGLDWPGRYGGESVATQVDFDLISGETTSATASIVGQPLPALDLASSQGWAKILRQATVITANGNKANYSSGGEQNFAVATGLTSTIQSVQFGTDVTVLPFFDAKSGDMQITVDANVSELVPALSGTTIPGRTTAKLSTKVQLKLGQSLVLSGIRSSSDRRAERGLPFLSSIPVLGLLFGSHNLAAEDVEGAIFIVPSAVDAVPKPARQMVDSALAQFAKYDGDLADVEPFPPDAVDWSRQVPAAPGASVAPPPPPPSPKN